jgi:hypothetical protein
MNLEMAIRAKDDQVIEVLERFFLVVLVAILARWVYMVNVQTALALAVSAKLAAIIKHIEDRLPAAPSIFSFPKFKWLNAFFSSAFFGVLKKIVVSLFSILPKPQRADLLVVNWTAGSTPHMTTGIRGELVKATHAPTQSLRFQNVLLPSLVFLLIHVSKFNVKTWNMFGLFKA